jgi:hypothetical protein
MNSAMPRKVGTKTPRWTAAAVKDTPAAKKPRIETYISTPADEGVAVDAHTPYALPSNPPNNIVSVPRAPRRSWKPEEDAQLMEAVQKCGKSWVAVATRVPGRTNVQCHNRWVNKVDPSIKGENVKSTGKWTAKEDAKLSEGVKTYGKDWVAVALRVPGRTNVQCCHRWVDGFDPCIDRGPPRSWKPEEDAKLTSAVKTHGNDWAVVASLVPGRTNVQCRHRWVRHVDPNTNRKMGKWISEEDAQLIRAVKKNGKDWVAVAALVPGRTNFQCHNRWVNHVEPTVKGKNANTGFWTMTEDAKLTRAVKKHGNDWLAVAKQVPGRTHLQCRLKWINSLDPSIDRATGKWTAEEDANLGNAVRKCGKDWVAVAPLVPGRTNLQCRQRWVKYLDPPIDLKPKITGFWSAQEDAKLTSAIEKHGKNWVAVALLIAGRTNLQCRKRWQVRWAAIEGLPTIMGERDWIAEEDAKLIDAIKTCGKDWDAVAMLVPGRTNLQCRKRWTLCEGRTVEGTPIPKGKWSAEEDASQSDAIKKCGNDRATVAALVPGRTNVQRPHTCERLEADARDKEMWRQWDRSGRVGSRSKEFTVSCSYF